jgi:hypothetical protein
MILNYDQKALLLRLRMFIDSDQNGIFGVFGPGGTGKTFTVTSLPNSESFKFLAPTNKASKVVTDNLKKRGINNKCMTIDRFLGYRQTKDEKNETVVTFTSIDKLQIPKVIVIDEISMINAYHFDIIKILVEKCKIIAIGDYLQLPPVIEKGDKEIKYINEKGFECSKIFQIIENSYTLQVQVRQKEDSTLYSMISTFRNEMSRKIDFYKLANFYKDEKEILLLDINSKEYRDFVESNNFTSIAFKRNTVDFLAYKTAVIRTGNKKVNIKKVEVGNLYYFEKACFTENRTYYTSEVVRIGSIEDDELEIEFPITGKIFKESVRKATLLSEDYDYLGTVYLSNGDFTSKVNRHRYYYADLSRYSKKEVIEMNTFYNDFKNRFAHLKQITSTTIHKSQGSTYKKIVIPLFDFAVTENYFRQQNQRFYVAISRASDQIVFVTGKSNFGEHKYRVLFTEEERNLIAGINDYKCSSCSIEFESERDFEIHHIIPLENQDQRGNNSISNLTTLCKSCHKITHNARPTR